MMPLPSFCQLNSIGSSDEAAQVKLASDPNFTFASFRSWVMVGGSVGEDKVLKSVNQPQASALRAYEQKFIGQSAGFFCMQ